ncbi:MAG: hypothetical protein OXF44_11965 [Anaerolineaceae bacterium]|nr:hypothetical protein [Anaerolineaceae bacterium]MCY4022104.1 hypothetical protein [Anaerolineaceae bacterium]
MAEINLTQAEADALLAMEKHTVDERPVSFPVRGQKSVCKLKSRDGREEFFLDLSRGRIDLRKIKLQNRARKVVRLARLDLSGGPHQNPDGEYVPTPHLHLYCEGYDDKWAKPLPEDIFPETNNELVILEDFLRFCNIRGTQVVQMNLL